MLPWLITPFRSTTVNTPQSRFNKSHSSGRNIIERTIGVWKNCFRCLLGVARHLHYSPEKSVKIINVAAALHNIRIYFKMENDDFEQNAVSSEEIHEDEEFVQAMNEGRNYSTDAANFRSQVLLNF